MDHFAAAALDFEIWFTFEVGHPSGPALQTAGCIRHTVHSRLDGLTFERFHVDVGVGDPLVEPVEYLVAPDLLSFAEIDPVIGPCYPISQQLAEKCHAYVIPYASSASSRIKDFIDIILFAEMRRARGRR